MAMEEKKKNFDLLPPEITADILSRVVADSVSNCKLVCKTWRSHIDHPSFIDDHTRHVYLNDSSMDFFVSTYFSHRTGEYKLYHGEYNEDDEGIMPFKLSKPITHHPYPLEPLYNFDVDLNITSDYDPMDIVSCNGLIFTGSTLSPFDMLYIYNPFTTEYVDLKPGFVSSGISSEIYDECLIANGFGYLPSTNEYKIVRICYGNEKALGSASVYTLGSGKWRSLGEIPHKLLCNAGILERGLQIDGLGMKSFMTYESNIHFARRFMIDCTIVGANWIEVSAGKYKKTARSASHCQLEFDCLYSEVISHTPEGEFSKMAPFRVLSFDIECAGRKGFFPKPTHDLVIQVANLVTLQGESQAFLQNIMTLKSCSHIVGADVMPFDTEREVLLAWRDFIREVDPNIIIGYNICNFDLPYLIERAAVLKILEFSSQMACSLLV